MFFGWWIVGAGFLIQMLHGALLFHAFSAYVLPLQQEFGWSRLQLSSGFALLRAESGLLGPIQGWLLDRFGSRPIMAVGIVVFAAGFVLFGAIQSLTDYYICFVLMALGSSFAGFLSIITVIAKWFNRKRSTAIGFMLSGMSTGGLLVPLIVWSIAEFGWRGTAVVSGLTALIIGLPLTMVIRQRPQDYGILPDGALGHPKKVAVPDGQVAMGHESSGPTGDLTLRQALISSSFWMLSLVHASALLIVGAVLMHQIPHMVEGIGLSPKMAATMVAALVFCTICGQIGGGYLGDRINKRLTIFGCMWLHAAAMCVFAYASSSTATLCFAVMHGLAWGVRGTLINSIRVDYFGGQSFATITGFSSTIVMTGMIGGPLFAGFLRDWYGDYRVAFLSLAGMAALGSIAMLVASPPKRKSI